MELWYTLGPSSRGKEAELFLAGATGVRLTFSYGTPELQAQWAQEIKETAARVGRRCTVVADLAGEKARLGTFEGPPTIPVKKNTTVKLVLDAKHADSQRLALPVPNSSFFSQVREGSIVTVGDGAAMLELQSVTGGAAVAMVLTDGVIDQCRGLSIQGAEFNPSPLTTKDEADLEYILSSPLFDLIALSFVGHASDVQRVRRAAQQSNRDIPILAKIETGSGVEHIRAICDAADLVMAARGDLALTQPWVELPCAVKRIASAAAESSVPWILATQVAEGLERFAIPTRAEICDLAHWLEEGCAGVLLSYETAFGSHAEAAVASVAALLARWAPRCD